MVIVGAGSIPTSLDRWAISYRLTCTIGTDVPVMIFGIELICRLAELTRWFDRVIRPSPCAHLSSKL